MIVQHCIFLKTPQLIVTASERLDNAGKLGDCSGRLISGAACRNVALAGYYCTLSTCDRGDLAAGDCYEQGQLRFAALFVSLFLDSNLHRVHVKE